MEAQTQNDELYPIAVLIDELKVRKDIWRAVVKPSIGANTDTARRCVVALECNPSLIHNRLGSGCRANEG